MTLFSSIRNYFLPLYVRIARRNWVAAVFRFKYILISNTVIACPESNKITESGNSLRAPKWHSYRECVKQALALRHYVENSKKVVAALIILLVSLTLSWVYNRLVLLVFTEFVLL